MVERYLPTPIMHRVVEHHGVLYLGGVVADDFTGDITAQMQQICAKLDDLLTQGNSGNELLLTATIFLSDLSLKAAMDVIWKQWLGPSDLPSRATLAVSDLGAGILAEVVCTAATHEK